MGILKEKMFGTDLLRQCMHFPEYEEMYTMMKPDFSKIGSKENREEIEDSILAYQVRARFNIAEYYFLKNVGLEDKIEDITNDVLNFKNYEDEFCKRIYEDDNCKGLDQSFYDNMQYTCYGTFDECDTLADKFLHRVLTIQNLLGYYNHNSNDKYMKNEINNFHTLGTVILDYFLSDNLLRYMELVDRDKTVERYNNPELFQQLSGFANFYLSETEEYNKLYNEIIKKKNKGKQLKKTLAKPNQQ